MTRFGKPPVLILLLLLAMLVASVFGALHNQLSYSVGPSYFTALKFPQFGIDPETPARLGAAWVGVQASWWVGALVGMPAFLYGLLAVPTARSYLAAGIGAIGLVVVLSLLAACLGLVGGIFAAETGLLDSYIAPPEGVDRAEFLRAGMMHDAGYLGGFLGALLAFWPMRRARAIDMTRAEASHA